MRYLRRVLCALSLLIGCCVGLGARAGASTFGTGYWLLAGDGGLFSFGQPFFGSAAGDPGNCAQPMGAAPDCSILTPTPDGGGYYIVNPLNGGTIYNFGDAPSLASLGLQQPTDAYNGVARFMVPEAVALSTTKTMKGLFLVESNGDIFTSGDAAFAGSPAPGPPHPPASAFEGPNPTPFSFYVGGALTPTGKGYWVVNSSGAVYNFGDAGPFGTVAVALNAPIIAMTPTPDGQGYWLLASDGGIFSFGDARFFGSTGNLRLNAPVVGMASTSDGQGYWLVAADGGVFSYGDAAFHGSTGGMHINSPVTGMAAA